MFHEGNDLQMLIEIRRPGCSDAQRVDFGMHEAVEIIEDHRRIGGAEPGELLRGLVQAPPLLRGADNEDPHVMLGGRLDGTPIRPVHEIPVEVHIVEGIAGDDLLDQIARSVRRESKEGGPPLMNDLPRGFECPTGADCLLPALPVVDSVNGEKVDMSQL